MQKGDLKEVYAGSILDIGMVKSFLESNKIESYVKDEIMGTLNPWWTAPGGAGAIKLLVAESDFETAKNLVIEYEQNLNKE